MTDDWKRVRVDFASGTWPGELPPQLYMIGHAKDGTRLVILVRIDADLSMHLERAVSVQVAGAEFGLSRAALEEMLTPAGPQ